MTSIEKAKLELTCYYQGCQEHGVTREHIPPQAFFPDGETLQLLTVKSCPTHNNAKSQNDLCVHAQICMNASSSNRAREVFQNKVAPQLSHNNHALRQMLGKGPKPVDGGVAYAVAIARLDDFFTALSCGLIYKSQKAQLPLDYTVGHVYHGFTSDDAELSALASAIDVFYAKKHLAVMTFGKPDIRNERIYTCEIHGLPNFQGSITSVHKFFGNFKITSMLTKLVSFVSGIPSMSEC
ncbi:MAG: hypothetical protein NTW20_17340 [Rhodobacterales bacterium]|nr:hypothetical protein [Rhodobacterales bacterium]